MEKNLAVYTHAPIGKTMLKTGLSMLPGTIAMSGYNIVDTFFVGQLGKLPLAAMGFTFPIVMLLGCVFRGLGMGVMTCTAQELGNRKHHNAVKLVSSGTGLILLVSIVLAVAGMLSGRRVFGLMGAEGETLNLVLGYMDIWYFGCCTAALTMTGNDLLIAAGHTKTASMLMTAGLLLNSLLDPLFIMGGAGLPAMGIRGAALATIISQLMSVIAAMSFLYFRDRLLSFARIGWGDVKKAWWRIAGFALPSCAGMLMLPAGAFIITVLTSHFGDAAVAATAACSRIEMVAFMFPMALGMSILPMVGQNYGAGLYDRIRFCRRFSMRFAFLFLLGVAVLYFVAAEWLVNMFLPDDTGENSIEEVRRIMITCLHIIPWGFGCVEVHRFAGFTYTGCNRPSVAAWLNALRIMGLMVPLSFLAWYFDWLEGLFYARLVSDILAGTVAFLLARNMTAKLPENSKKTPQTAQNRA